MRAELARLVYEGKTEQQIVDYYIAKYGSQEPLASPIDQGLQSAGVGVAVRAGHGRSRARRHGGREVVAPEACRRFAGRGGSASSEAAALEARLDDELRDLD